MSQLSSSQQYQQWVRELREPHTRRSARQKLVAAGAVEPLLKCLDSHNESVVWAAVESLGELRATEAVGPLVKMLERGRLTLDVCEALRRITGRDFGVDVPAWQRWMQSSGEVKAPAFDFNHCIEQAGAYLGAEPSGSGKSYRFQLSLPSGREQKVALYLRPDEDNPGDDLVVIYSECGPANPKYYEAVLRKNLAIPAGAFAIRDLDGKPNFVMVDTMFAASITPSSLAKHVENVAHRADLVEKAIAKEDIR